MSFLFLPLLPLLPLLVIFFTLEATADEQYQKLFAEQRLEESIATFLTTIQQQQQKQITHKISPNKDFDEAYKIYLNLQGKPSQDVAIEIIQKYHATPSNPYLDYLLAASYANLGRFDRFYPLFLSAYSNDSDHYLADKMLAVLHIKLYERLPLGVEKEAEREQVLNYLQKALEKNSSDPMLYKMQLAFVADANRPKQVDILVRKMIDTKVVYPRSDLLFYVKAALSVGNKTLAQEFVDYSRTLFGYSRSLEAAQNIIDCKE